MRCVICSYSLENSLNVMKVGVERRQALALATPTIWPAHGWLTDSFGNRSDPFTGEAEFHTGLDISTDKGEPVFATANGVVQAAGPSGAYGNMVVVDHGFGLSTRYAHLDHFNVKVGDTVQARCGDWLCRRDGPRHRRSRALRSAGQRPDAQPAPLPRRPLVPSALFLRLHALRTKGASLAMALRCAPAALGPLTRATLSTSVNSDTIV